MQVFNKIRSYLVEYGLKEFIWLVFFSLILIPYYLVLPVQSTLGPSWELSISLAIKNKLVFGTDYIFTYGPLGVFSDKHTIAVSKYILLCFELCMLGLMIFILRHVLKNFNYHILSYPFIILVLFLLKANYLVHLLTPIFLFFIFYFLNYQKLFAIVIAACISIIAFYIKVNYGIILVGLLYSVFVLAMAKKIINIKQVLSIALAHIVSMYLLGFLLNVDLIPYVQSSLHLIDAYNDAIYLPIDLYNIHLLTALLIIMLFILGFFISFKHYTHHFLAFCLYIFCGFFLYLLFKNGFVRADEHMVEYFKITPLAFALMCVFEKGHFKKRWTILMSCALLVSYFMLMNTHRTEGHPLPVKKYFKNGNYFKDIFQDVSSRNYLLNEHRSPEKVSQRFADEIKNQSVDIIPWEISEIYYYKMNYNPRPIVQSYSVFDEYLDTKNYEMYSSVTKPEYIIYACASIDNRHPFWDESITKRAMLCNYELVNSDSTYLLLKKRKQALRMNILKEKKTTLEIGKEYKIENTENIQYLFADVKYNTFGKLRRLLFQPPPLQAVLTYEDGTKQEYKAITTILRTGVLLNRKVENIQDAQLFFLNSSNKGLKVISILLKGDYGFNNKVEATIKEVAIGE